MLSARPYKTTGYTFHAYPNGDSMPLRDAYGLYEAETFIRGTLRYEGNPSLIKTLVDLGWLCPEAKKWLGRGWTLAQIQERITMAASPSEADLVARMDQLFKYTSPEGRDRIISGLRWIGLFCNETPALHRNLLDNLIAQLVRRCSFQPGERDLVMLQQTFMVQWRDGSEVGLPLLSFLAFPCLFFFLLLSS